MKAFMGRMILAIGLGAWTVLGGANASPSPAPGTLKWVFQLEEGAGLGHPSLAPDEAVVYIPGAKVPSSSCLIALSAEGDLEWTSLPLEELCNRSMVAVVGPNGSIYGRDIDNILAFTSEGEIRWVHPEPSNGELTVWGALLALSPDGSQLYVSIVRQQGFFGPLLWSLYALKTSDGSLVWEHPFEDLKNQLGFPPPPLILEDGSILVVAEHHQGGQNYALLMTLSPDGQLQKSVEIRLPDPSTSAPFLSPVVGSNGSIYQVYKVYGEQDRLIGSSIYAFGLDGSIRWSFATDELILTEPVLGSDRTIYLVTIPKSEDITAGRKRFGNTLWALNSQGAVKWTLQIPEPFVIVYYQFGDFANITPAVGADGVIYLATEVPQLRDTEASQGRLYAISPEGEILWSFDTIGSILSSPALAKDGTLYFTTHGPCKRVLECERRVYAIQTGSSGPAISPWPMLRGDPQRSGQVHITIP